MTAVLGLAANTSFGGLPVLMSLLAKDHRLPHAFYLRAERPVFRIGIIVLALAAVLLLVASGAKTNNLIPLYAIGVFIGFTLSQVGLVRHWRRERSSRWRLRAGINGGGAVMTAIAVVVLLGTKFLEGAWVVVIAVPLLLLLFARTEAYYDGGGARAQARPDTAAAAQAREHRPRAHLDRQSAHRARRQRRHVARETRWWPSPWPPTRRSASEIIRNWQVGVRGADRGADRSPPSLVRSVLRYVESIHEDDAIVTVLIPEIVPRKRRHEILHNQRGRLLAAVLRARTDVIVARLPFKLHD